MYIVKQYWLSQILLSVKKPLENMEKTHEFI